MVCRFAAMAAASLMVMQTPAVSDTFLSSIVSAAEAATDIRHRPARDLLCPRANRCRLSLGPLRVTVANAVATFHAPDDVLVDHACVTALETLTGMDEVAARYVLSKGRASVDQVRVVVRQRRGMRVCSVSLSGGP